MPPKLKPAPAEVFRLGTKAAKRTNLNTPVSTSSSRPRNDAETRIPKIEMSRLVEVVEPLFSDRSSLDQAERYLCTAVQQLQEQRSCPELVALSLAVLARHHREKLVSMRLFVESLASLLMPSSTAQNAQRKGIVGSSSSSNASLQNPKLVERLSGAPPNVFAANLLMCVLSSSDEWPECILRAYCEDAAGPRDWVDHPSCQTLCENVVESFPGKQLQSLGKLSIDRQGCGAVRTQSSLYDSPLGSPLSGGDESSSSCGINIAALEDSAPRARYERRQIGMAQIVAKTVADADKNPSGFDWQQANFLRFLTTVAGYPDVRALAALKLDKWLQLKVAQHAARLLHAVAINCSGNTDNDQQVIGSLIEKVKTKNQLQAYLRGVDLLVDAHPSNLHTVLRRSILNELSSSTRNFNNCHIIARVMQQHRTRSAQLLADVCHELLSQPEDYTKPLRSLLREVNRWVRHDLDWTALCRQLMIDRKHDLLFKNLDVAAKERYLLSIVDLVCIAQLLSAYALREPWKRKEAEPMQRHYRAVEAIQTAACAWLADAVASMMPTRPDLTPSEHLQGSQRLLKSLKDRLLFLEERVSVYWVQDNWPPESDRAWLLKLCREVPVSEEALARLLALGLEDRVQNADLVVSLPRLVQRVAEIPAWAELGNPLCVTEPRLLDLIFNCCMFRAPVGLQLPDGYEMPRFAVKTAFWAACTTTLFLAAYNPATVGKLVWERYATLRALMDMIMKASYDWPPESHLLLAKQNRSDAESRERQLRVQEQNAVLHFESLIVGYDIAEEHSKLFDQLMFNKPDGPARQPPDILIDSLRDVNARLKLGRRLCHSRQPDFLKELIDLGGDQAWLVRLVEDVGQANLSILPVQCLAEYLMAHLQAPHETAAMRQELLDNLKERVGAPGEASQELLRYFMQRLTAPQAVVRRCAHLCLSQILAPSDSELDTKDDVGLFPSMQWLLCGLTALPHFNTSLRDVILPSLRHALSLETEPEVLAGYLLFLSQHCTHLSSQSQWDTLGGALAGLLVNRPTASRALFSSARQPGHLRAQLGIEQRLRLGRAALSVCERHLEVCRSANEITMSNDSDTLMVQLSETLAPLPIRVVQSHLLLLCQTWLSDESSYQTLLRCWIVSEEGHLPQYFAMNADPDQAELVPDWLRLCLLRAGDVPRLQRAALHESTPCLLVSFFSNLNELSRPDSALVLLDELERLLIHEEAKVVQSLAGFREWNRLAEKIEFWKHRGVLAGPAFHAMVQQRSGVAVAATDERMLVDSKSIDEVCKVGSSVADSESLLGVLSDKENVANKFVSCLENADLQIYRQLLRSCCSSKGREELVLSLLHTLRKTKFATRFVKALHDRRHLATPLFNLLLSGTPSSKSAVATSFSQVLRSLLPPTSWSKSVLKHLVEPVPRDASMDEKCMGGDVSAAEQRFAAKLESMTLHDAESLLSTQRLSDTGLVLDWLTSGGVEQLSEEHLDRFLFETDSRIGAHICADLLHHVDEKSLERIVRRALLPSEKLMLDSSSRVDPSRALNLLTDFMSHPRLLPLGREHGSKAVSTEPLIKLDIDEVCRLVELVIEEAAKSRSEEETSRLAKRRAALIRPHVCSQSIARAVVQVLERATMCTAACKQLIVELYCLLPMLLLECSAESSAWLTCRAVLDVPESTADQLVQRLLSSLCNRSDSVQLDASLAIKLFARRHPTLLLRHLPLMAALVAGRMELTWSEFRRRGNHYTFTHLLSVMELLGTELFLVDCEAASRTREALHQLLTSFLQMFLNYSDQGKAGLMSTALGLAALLRQYRLHAQDSADKFLTSQTDLLAALGECGYVELGALQATNSAPLPPVQRWSTAQLVATLRKLRQEQDLPELLQAIRDIDEASKRKPDIVDYYVGELETLVQHNCPEVASASLHILLRYLRYRPGGESGGGAAAAFLQILRSEDPQPELLSLALKHLPEVCALCLDMAPRLLQAAANLASRGNHQAMEQAAEAVHLINLETLLPGGDCTETLPSSVVSSAALTFANVA